MASQSFALHEAPILMAIRESRIINWTARAGVRPRDVVVDLAKMTIESVAVLTVAAIFECRTKLTGGHTPPLQFPQRTITLQVPERPRSSSAVTS